MKNIAILFSGEGTTFAYLADHLPLYGVRISVALTNNPDAGGTVVAQDHDIPLEIVDHRSFVDREAFDTEVVRRLKRYDPDLTVLAGFMRIVTPVFTGQIRAINLHPSLLPRHKGLDAIRRSWEDKYDEGGVSIHWVSNELDSGEIFLQKSINKRELSLEAYTQKIRILEKKALLEAILLVLQSRGYPSHLDQHHG